MRKNSIWTAAAWATGTCVVSLALFLPGGLQADATAPADVPSIVRDGGVELSITLAGAERIEKTNTYKLADGVKPKLTLIAHNTAGASAQAHAKVQVLAMKPQSPLSRTPSLSMPIFTKESTLAVTPNGDQSIELTVDKPLATGDVMTVRIEAGGKAIEPIRFVTAATQVTSEGGVVMLAQPQQTLAPQR